LLPNTEQDSLYPNLSELDTFEILNAINSEDKKVALAVQNELQSILNLCNATFEKMLDGGRLFYIGAGTSGRLGILDASECPPTYGVDFGLVLGIIAGGDSAIRKAVEFAEDDTQQAIKDLDAYQVNEKDTVVGISASGRTPYVFGGLEACQKRGIQTGSITCSRGSVISSVSNFPIEIVVGPEIITGSTRMKSGTAQKMVLNMLTSTVMIKLKKVDGSKMVNMQLSNDKLIDRGTRMIVEQTGLNYEESKEILLENGSVKKALEKIKNTK
jgi:N-acetylmuramic acid 6-phosphate etherase